MAGLEMAQPHCMKCLPEAICEPMCAARLDYGSKLRGESYYPGTCGMVEGLLGCQAAHLPLTTF